MSKITTLINTLNKKFPKINAVPSEDFDGNAGGIWFRQEGNCHPKDDVPYFDYWNTNQQTHPEVEAVLDAAGFFAEPYDGGTWFAWS